MGTNFYFGNSSFLYHSYESSLSCGHKEVKKMEYEKEDILFNKASQVV